MAKNEVATENASLTLEVMYPPKISIQANTFREISMKDDVIIYCNIIANPAPSVIDGCETVNSSNLVQFSN